MHSRKLQPIFANTLEREMMLLFLLLVSAVPSLASNSTDSQRAGKQNIGIFNVVKFPNDACGGTNNLNGTCYTASECTAKSGTSSGSCASGFGVCCTFSLSCGGSASENNTYAIKSSFSTTADSDPCKYTICKLTDNICKLRLDFETFVIAPAFTYVASATAAIAAANGFKLGGCYVDSFTVTNPGGVAPPVICGTNTGQHMFIPASPQCNTMSFNIATGSNSVTRSWQVKVTQYECGSMLYPDRECLQWLTASSGTFWNFGFDTGATISQTSHAHLQSQYYDICFRRARGYCSLCFAPQIFTIAIATAFTSYGVGSPSTIAFLAATDSSCGLSAAIASVTTQDYIEVVNLQPLIGTIGATGRQKICGAVFNAAAIAVVHTAANTETACTWAKPFRWGVRFDAQERQVASGNEDAANSIFIDTFTPTTGDGFGFTGFYMAFWQNTCT